MADLGIFLSHIHSEQSVVEDFAQTFGRAFLNRLEFFRSSSEESIRPGQDWNARIMSNLKNCDALILFLSPKSVGRPWINFEAGAGMVRNIPVIPLCHSGLERGSLPAPLSFRQAYNLSDQSHLEAVLRELAKLWEGAVPEVDMTPLAGRVAAFERQYTYLGVVAESLMALGPPFSQAVARGPFPNELSFQIDGRNQFDVERALRPLVDFGLITYRWGQGGLVLSASSALSQMNLEVQVLAAFEGVIAELNPQDRGQGS